MLLGFKKRFVEPIQIGTKVFTMRKRRKVRPKIGEQLYMYTGLRTSNCQKITDKEKLMSIQNVRILIKRVGEGYCSDSYVKIWVDKRLLTTEEQEAFVQFDGFFNEIDFADYWLKSGKPKKKGHTKTLGAYVELFHWTDLKY